MNLGAFAVIAAIQSRPGVTSNLSTFAGLVRREPTLALLMTLFLLSLTGIPPTAGFFGKFYVILAAVQAGGWLTALAVLAMLNATVAAFYYLRVVVYMFMRDPDGELAGHAARAPRVDGPRRGDRPDDRAGALPGACCSTSSGPPPPRSGRSAVSSLACRSGCDGHPRQDRSEAGRHQVRPDAAQRGVADDAVRIDPEVDRQRQGAPRGLGRTVEVQPHGQVHPQALEERATEASSSRTSTGSTTRPVSA